MDWPIIVLAAATASLHLNLFFLRRTLDRLEKRQDIHESRLNSHSKTIYAIERENP